MVVVVFALVALGAAGIATVGAMRANAHNFAGVVESSGLVSLDTQSSGRIVAVLVRPGDQVKQGQLLAQQDTSVMDAAIAADRAAVASDALRTSQLQQDEASQTLTSRQVALAHSQASYAAASARAAASLAAAQRSVNASDAALGRLAGQVSQDQLRISSCSPQGAAACQSLQKQLATDQANYQQQSVAAQLAQGQVQSAMSAMDNSLAAARSGFVSTQGLSQSALGDLQVQASALDAQTARDQARLTADLAQLAGQTIVAPADGMVLAVDGTAGDLDQPDGVRFYSTQTYGRPSAPSSALTPNATSQTVQQPTQQPLVVLSLPGPRRVVFQVTEGQVGSFGPGTQATAAIPAAGVRDLPLHFLKVDPEAISTTDGVRYQVIFEFNQDVPSTVLDGMTVNVRVR